MADQPANSGDTAPLAREREVDLVCSNFEKAWVEQRPQVIEPLLESIPDSLRSDALRELVALEVHLRGQAGESPTLAEYAGRFPDDGDTIQAAFELADRDRSEHGVTESLHHAPLHTSAGMKIGRYKLLEKLGEGGFGEVWAADQREPVKRRVALKVIKLGMDTKEVIARFEAERQALALMEHANIAQVLDAGTTDAGRPYFAMELVQGIPITRFCDDKKLNTRDRLALFGVVCQAIQHAHQKGVIHRDIKPSNILVSEQGGSRMAKVIDFGIAKAINQRLTERTIYTQQQQMIGTPLYMSPEQAELSPLNVDTRSDIYSLGVLLYEMLTGDTPFAQQRFDAASYDEIRRIIREEDPPKPSTRISALGDTTAKVCDRRQTDPKQLGSVLKGDLDWIVMKCLEKDRDRRYDSAHELEQDILRHLGNQPVTARPPSVGYRMEKAWRRNKAVWTAVLAVAAALIAAVAVSTSQAVVARRAQRESKTAENLAITQKREALRTAYLADMFVVQSALENHNVGRARRLLEEHRPQTGEEDLRDFEWYYFDRRAKPDQSTILGTHPQGARSLFTAPDGRLLTTTFRRIVFGPDVGELRLWEAGTGKLQGDPLNLRGVTAVALSKDGEHVAFARGTDIEIRTLANLGTVKKTLRDWRPRGSFGPGVFLMCFVKNDTQLAVHPVLPGGRGEEPTSQVSPSPLFLVDIDNDRAVAPTFTEPLQRILFLAVSDDSKRLAVHDGDKEVVLVDVADAAELRRITLPYYRAVSRGITPMLFVDNDRQLVTTSDEGQMDLWTVSDGKHARTLAGHDSNVTALSRSPDGTLVASSGLDQVVKIWDLSSSERSPELVLRGHEDEVWGVTFSPNGRSLITCGRDESIRRWDLASQDSELQRWVLPDGVLGGYLKPGILLAGTLQREWSAWDTDDVARSREPQPIVPPEQLRDELVIPLPRGGYRLTLSNPVVEEKPGWGVPLTLRRGPGYTRIDSFPEFALAISGMSYCESNRLIVHGAVEGEPHLLVWDTDAERTTQLIPTASDGMSYMAVSQDENYVLLGNPGSNTLEVVELASQTSSTVQISALQGIWAMAVLPGNKEALLGGQPGVLCHIDLATGSVLDTASASLLGLHAMALSPNATRIATGDAQGKIKLWDVETLREVAVLGSHPALLRDIRFLPDGRTLLSLCNRELRIWRAR